jgi:hypothetical protein
MRKFYFTLFLSICGIINMAHGQSKDKEQVINQCISLETLKEKLPAELQRNINEYKVLNHGIDFTDLYNMKVNGVKVSFIDKSQTSITNGYFLFHTVNVEESKAFVRYYFTYNVNKIEKVIPITIDFVKEGSSWRIINYTI